MKELRSYFKSPLGYVFIGVILALFGIYYSIFTLYMGYADYGVNILQSTFSLVIYIIYIYYVLWNEFSIINWRHVHSIFKKILRIHILYLYIILY